MLGSALVIEARGKRRMKRVVAACLGVSLAASPAAPAFAHGEESPYTVYETRDTCIRGQRDPDSKYASICEMFLHGVHDAYQQATAERSELRPFCPPEGTAPEALRDAFIEWANNNPRDLQKPDVYGVVRAWTAAFPCK